MSKRTLSGSEIYAHSKNRHEQNYLKEKLLSLSQTEFQSLDSNRVEKQKWREFLVDNARNTGWSPMAMRPDDMDDDDCFDGPGSPSSPTSPRRRFELQFIPKYQKPWAYSFKQGSYNKVYRELTEVGESSKKNMPSPRVTLSSSSSEPSGVGHPRLAQHVSAVKGLERARSAWGRADKLLTQRQPDLSPRPKTSMNLMEFNEVFEFTAIKTENKTESSKPKLTRQVSMVNGVERAKSAWLPREKHKSIHEDEPESENASNSTENTSKPIPKLARQVTVLQGLHKSKDAWICSLCGEDKRPREPLDTFAHTTLVYKGLERAKAALERLLPPKKADTETQMVEAEETQSASKKTKCLCRCKTSRALKSKATYPWTKNGHVKTCHESQGKNPSKQLEIGAKKVRRVGVVSLEGSGRIPPTLQARKKTSNSSNKLKSTTSETCESEKTFQLTKDSKKMVEISESETFKKRVESQSRSNNSCGSYRDTEKVNTTNEVMNELTKTGTDNAITHSSIHLSMNKAMNDVFDNIDPDLKVSLAHSHSNDLTIQPERQLCTNPLISNSNDKSSSDTSRINNNKSTCESKENVIKAKNTTPIPSESILKDKVSESHNDSNDQGRVLAPRSVDADGEINVKTSDVDRKSEQQKPATAKRLWKRTSLPIDTLNFLEKIKGQNGNSECDVTNKTDVVRAKTKPGQSVVKQGNCNKSLKDKSLSESKTNCNIESDNSHRPKILSAEAKLLLTKQDNKNCEDQKDKSLPESESISNCEYVSNQNPQNQNVEVKSVIKQDNNNEGIKEKILTRRRTNSNSDNDKSYRPTRRSTLAKGDNPQTQNDQGAKTIGRKTSLNLQNEQGAIINPDCKDLPGVNDLVILIKPSRQKNRKPVQKKEENVFYKIARVMLKKVREKRAIQAFVDSMEDGKKQEDSISRTDSKSDVIPSKEKRQSVASSACRKLSMINAFYNNMSMTSRGRQLGRENSIAKDNSEVITANNNIDNSNNNNCSVDKNMTNLDSPNIATGTQNSNDNNDMKNDITNALTSGNPNGRIQEEDLSNTNLNVDQENSDTASSVSIVSAFNSPSVNLKNGVLDYDTTKPSFTDTSKYVEHKGVRIKNYVSPQKKYKTAATDKHKRGASLKWHSVEGAMVVAHQSKDKPRVAEVFFPKQARQKMLTKMVEENHVKPVCNAAELAEAALRKRIEQFLQSVEPLCQSPKN